MGPPSLLGVVVLGVSCVASIFAVVAARAARNALERSRHVATRRELDALRDFLDEHLAAQRRRFVELSDEVTAQAERMERAAQREEAAVARQGRRKKRDEASETPQVPQDPEERRAMLRRAVIPAFGRGRAS